MVTKRICLAALAALSFCPANPASAQVFPSHPISMIVPYNAGGPSDTVGRIIADGMRSSLGQPIVIENIGGASGSIGVGKAARAAPDGYTLVLGSLPTHVLNGATYALRYDLLNDFEPTSLIGTSPQLIVARKSMPAQSLRELIDWLKANPDKASQGTTGAGALSHLAGVLFQKETGTRYRFVPYRGSASAIPDLVAGQIDLMIDQASNALPQALSGSIKGYAVTAKTRLPSAPEIPTVDEAGLPGFYVGIWYGIWAPKGTPRDIVEKLESAVFSTLANPSVRHRFANLEMEIFPRDGQTGEALRTLQKSEIEKWWPIIKQLGIKAE